MTAECPLAIYSAIDPLREVGLIVYTKLFLLAILTALILSLFFASGCDKLTTQINNNTYYDSTLGNACLSCHGDNSSQISVPKGQWANSGHASSALIYSYATFGDTTHYLTAQCGPICHTSQGFQQYALTKSSGAQGTPSVIDCFTCHLPHTGAYGAWRLDTLRGNFPFVDLLDLSEYNMGKSNQCVACHQASQYPTLTGGVTSILSDSLGPDGPHSGSEAQMLLGTSGFLFGQAADTIHSHQSVASKNGCLSCHYGLLSGNNLGVAQGYDFGGHSFKLLDTLTHQQYTANCNVAGCHTVSPPPIVDFFTNTKLDSIRVLRDSLAGRLIALNILQSTGDSSHFYKDSTLSLYAARILYNYLLVKQDRSRGIHNPGYSLQLMEASLAHIDSIPHAALAAHDTLGCAGSAITFYNRSSDTTLAATWDFGDGSTPSPFAQHVFTKADSFKVTLTITGAAGSSSAHMYVFIDSTPRAGFTSAEDPTDTTHSTWIFTDTTANKPTAWLWNFGDSTTDVTQNPSHTYAGPRATPDTVLVRLTAFNRCGQNTKDSVQVIVRPTLIPGLAATRRR